MLLPRLLQLPDFANYLNQYKFLKTPSAQHIFTMSDTPPPYTASSRVAPASDTKYPYNPTDYGVGSSGQNIYPSAHDYVPPPAEQQARIPSAPPAEQFQAQQQQPQQLQYQQYQQQGAASYQVQPQPQPQQYQQQVQPNHKVYYTKAGVPVEIQTAHGPMVIVTGPVNVRGGLTSSSPARFTHFLFLLKSVPYLSRWVSSFIAYSTSVNP